MGSSSKTTKSSQTTTGTSTTTPNAPSWATNALQDYTNKVEGFGNSDPSQYVAPLTALQQQAASGAANLGSTWQPGLAQAQAGANSVYNAATPQIGSTSLTTPSGYTGQGYTGRGYTSSGYDPTLASAAQIDTADIQRLMSPYTDAVVNTTLAGYDKQAGQSMAALKAAAAANNAFSGSRYGIQEAEQQASSDLGRAQTEAQLRQADYAQALSGASTDAGFKNSTNLANAAASNAAAAYNAQAKNAAAEFGANASNTANQFNANSRNNANQFNAAASNAASIFNAGALNTTATNNANLQNDALARQLSASGLLGTLANNAGSLGLQDINAQSAQGQIQQQQDAQQRTAGLSQLQALESLLQGGQYGLLTGSTNNGTSTMNGTVTNTSSPGLGGILGAVGSGIAGLSGLGGTAGLAGLFNGFGSGAGQVAPTTLYPAYTKAFG